MQRLLVSFLALLCGGCAVFSEQHYLQTVDSKGNPVNYFRIRVQGNGGFSRMRYVSGYYDERAVDLYFNEVKPGGTPQDDLAIRPLFVANQKAPGTDETIKVFDPTTHGAFLMIFSSNPNAIADTIGQFAENQQVADAITNMLNSSTVDRVREAQAERTSVQKEQAASIAAIEPTITALPNAPTAQDKTAVTEGALSALRAIAVELGGDGNFKTFADAATWFNARKQ